MEFDTYVRNIEDEYCRASIGQRIAGEDWYPTARRIVDAIAEFSDTDPARIAAAIAALSPRNPWRWNVQDAAALAHAVRTNSAIPRVTTFNTNRQNAIAFLQGSHDWRTSALKVRSFVCNIMGDENAVTVDVWAVRIATNGAIDAVPNDRDYRMYADAYREAARRISERTGRELTPRSLQAITWLVAQSRGLGSRRVGDHTQTCKKGTFKVVAEQFTGQQALFNAI